MPTTALRRRPLVGYVLVLAALTAVLSTLLTVARQPDAHAAAPTVSWTRAAFC